MEKSSLYLVGVAVPTLRQLRSTVLSAAGPTEAVNALREAGYAGGDSIYSAFERWLVETGGSDISDAGELPLEQFGDRAATFFRDAGWGNVQFSHDEDEGVAVVDITDCWEADAGEAGAEPSCHLTTGMLASFFGKIAGYPVAVLETECCHGEESRCRFLLGNADVMNYKWNEMQAGS
ncbi:MAG TPA: V4R domain-containing protein [Gemmatimonadaceae bacterium]|nr:V4R domain-containing protein [Gemmatimonadaceae bacterium]